MPYPTAQDRARWEALPAATREAFVAAGEEALTADWPDLPATSALDFARHGNRGSFEGPHFIRRRILVDLVMAECVEGAGRFVDAAVDALWSICEESWWGWPAHLAQLQQAGAGLPDVDEPSIDLGVGESAAAVAWSSYLLGPALDAVSPLVRARVEAEVRRRVIEPFLTRDEWWRVMVHNWNPWCHSNIYAAALAIGAEADVAEKVRSGLDYFLAHYPADGGCDEGPTYWTRAAGCLFDCLEVMGDPFDDPLVARMGAYVLGVHIDGDWFVNFADGAPRFRLPGPMAFRFGRAVGDDRLASLGADAARRTFAEDPRMLDSFTRMLPALFGMDDWMTWPGRYTPAADWWLPDIQVMSARRGRMFAAAKGGHNDEVHNHNDVGNVVVFVDGEPVIVDPGVAPYTAQTFSERRYELWTMQSGWHSLPVVNGVEQRNGRSFTARQVACEPGRLRADIAGAYPEAAGLSTLVRTVSVGEHVEIADRLEFISDDNDVALHLITPLTAVVKAPGLVLLGDRAAVEFDPAVLTAELDGRELTEPNLAAVWGPFLTRVRLVAHGLPRSADLVVTVR